LYNAMNLNDLHSAAVSGDKAAEKQLIEKLAVRFRIVVRQRVWDKMDVEDLVQESLLVVSRKYARLQIEHSLAAWAQRVVDLVIKDYYRKRNREEARLAAYDAADLDMDVQSGDPSLKRRLIDCLQKLNGANQRHARVLNLAYQGFDAPEIAERMSLKVNNVYVILHRARRLLKQCLDTGETAL
jgi:RNA polymerase sigma factor (sigma-70 family)